MEGRVWAAFPDYGKISDYIESGLAKDGYKNPFSTLYVK
jgi:hypothetical protein